MTDELPAFSRIALALAGQVGKVAAPLMKQGIELEEALAAAYPIAAQQLIAAGEDRQEVEAALGRQLISRGILPKHQTFAISAPLHAALIETFEEGLKTLPEGPIRLDEVKVKAKTGFEMVLYPKRIAARRLPAREGPVAGWRDQYLDRG